MKLSELDLANSRINNLEHAYHAAQQTLEDQMRSPKTAAHKTVELDRDNWQATAKLAMKQRDEWEATARDAWATLDRLRAS
jgi:hypothetical protein